MMMKNQWISGYHVFRQTYLACSLVLGWYSPPNDHMQNDLHMLPTKGCLGYARK
jgi:hypothetical protein